MNIPKENRRMNNYQRGINVQNEPFKEKLIYMKFLFQKRSQEKL
jgi:hypothetical protein